MVLPVWLQFDYCLTAIVDELYRTASCHTIILYGSRARNTHTQESDYDILAVRAVGQSTRDARLWNGAYLDIFIYNEQDIVDIDTSFLRIRGGVLLRELQDFGHRLLDKVEQLYASSPAPLSEQEIELRRLWYQKMLKRIAQGDIEANYRRVWLLYALLEDYFALRQKWYLGSKASWEWLQTYHPDAYNAFAVALEPNATLTTIAYAVGTVFTTDHSGGRELY
jgi:uncharacterized protein